MPSNAEKRLSKLARRTDITAEEKAARIAQSLKDRGISASTSSGPSKGGQKKKGKGKKKSSTGLVVEKELASWTFGSGAEVKDVCVAGAGKPLVENFGYQLQAVKARITAIPVAGAKAGICWLALSQAKPFSTATVENVEAAPGSVAVGLTASLTEKVVNLRFRAGDCRTPSSASSLYVAVGSELDGPESKPLIRVRIWAQYQLVQGGSSLVI